MTGIVVYNGESFENAMRRFRKAVERAGILKEIKKHQTFEKPSEKRKRKLIAARKKQFRKMKEEV